MLGPNDVLLTPAVIAQRYRVTTSCVYRWMSDGVWIEGRNVRLAFIRVGGRRYATQAALDQFQRDCNPEPVPAPEPPPAAAARGRATKKALARRVQPWLFDGRGKRKAKRDGKPADPDPSAEPPARAPGPSGADFISGPPGAGS
jgi:hypothetical protein